MRWVLIRGRVEFDAKGEPVRAYGFAMDITERREAEAALRRSEERWNAAIENLGEGAIIATEDEEVIYWNPAARSMHGFTREGEGIEPLTETPNTFELWTPDGSHRLELDEWPMRRIKRGEPVRRLELRLRRPDQGWEKIVAYSGRMVETASGQRLIFLSVYDLTEQRRAEAALRELNAVLERKVAQRTGELERRARQLARLTLELSQTEDRERKRMADVLHDDLQQQLAAMKWHLTALKRGTGTEMQRREAAAQLEAMLTAAIQKSRSLSHELSPAVLYQDDLVDTFEWLAGQMEAMHGLAVRVEARGPVRVESDAMKAFLYKAGQEMLFNVVKHAGVRKARVRVRRIGGRVRVSVSDRGLGFDPQALRETSGFGLFSIRERAELLGGRMRIRSTPGEGSTLSVVVPEGDGAAPPRQDRVQAGRGADVRTLRVLVADDHAMVRQGLTAMLRNTAGMEVVGEAADGRAAVDLAWRVRPDVVVMDVAMPLISGDEATVQIRKHLPGTRVVALSMHDDRGTVERMQRAGAEAFVLKTAPPEDLLEAIRGR